MEWHPHTEQPQAVCSAVIAIPCDMDDDGSPPCVILKPGIWIYHPETGWRDETTSADLDEDVFWWHTEQALVAPLEVPTAETA